MYNQQLLELGSEDNIYCYDHLNIIRMYAFNKHLITVSSNNNVFCNICIFQLLKLYLIGIDLLRLFRISPLYMTTMSGKQCLILRLFLPIFTF